MPGRMDNAPREPLCGEGQCTDCDARFTIKLYPYDTKGTAFVRDHPQNGCHVKHRRTIATKNIHTSG